MLVLGSMPGRRSLEAGQYYAHPRNAFWPICGALFGFDPAIAYPRRLEYLVGNRVALWDVIGACVRPGSLDSAIDEDSIVPNDFSGFLRAHPDIRWVVFNGAKAEQAWRRHVAPALGAARLSVRRLPSTSPAHASLTVADKLRAWRIVAMLSRTRR